MLRIVRNAVLAAACAWAPFPAGAVIPAAPPQGADEDVVQTLHDTSARTKPSADAPEAFAIGGGQRLSWVVQMKKDGFYRVIRRGKGPQGWIAEADLKVIHEHEPRKEESTKVCAKSLDRCPMRGCAVEGTPEARDNEMKRTKPRAGKPVVLSFDDFAQLQREADERIGQGPNDLTPEQHAAIRGMKVANGSVTDGDPVRVIGYISKSNEGLHVNKSGESVNCMLKKPDDNDIHIPLVEHPGDTEFQGIVVEMIPQDRPAAWTVEALKELQNKGTQVWVEGGLAYDKVHYVSADPDNPFKDEPERMSLWEVHPITRFLVCNKEQCDAQNEDDWSPLEQQ